LNDLKNTTRSFLFQTRDKIKWDLFLVNELSISWLFVSKREVILLLVSRWETELLLASELKTELLLVSELKTELLLSSKWETRLLLANELKTELLLSRLIASSRVLKFESSTRLEKCRVELNFFWKSVELNWEVEFKHSSRVEKLDSIIRLENSTWLDKILDRCK